MNERTLLDRLLSPAGFGLVLILFFLPFVAVSCDTEAGPMTATFTGLDMVAGGQPTLSGRNVTDEEQRELLALISRDVDAEPAAILATIVIFGAMALTLVRAHVTRHAASVTAAVLATSLLAWAEYRSLDRLDALRASAIDGLLDAPPTGSSSPRYGFWLATVTLLILAGAHGVALIRARRRRRVPTQAAAP